MRPDCTNRLAGERSPYLRQHAHNPVDWYPWGEAAFDRARAEQKPIFLSVGYSTCHWCHVMAQESFENPAIANLLNRDFISIKVDREERPDVDRVYMAYVQAATGHGGWPMSVWMTPERKPFFGGTYFPPEDRWGRPGLATVLEALARAWRERREELRDEGERVTKALRQLAEAGGTPPTGTSDAALAADVERAWEGCLGQLNGTFDPVQGGFGGAPKFPRAAAFQFLFHAAARAGMASAPGAAALPMVALTLRKMAEGGIHDHVGGGFHRYAVDEEWFVPHFEKMLYDQAQLAVCYLEARRATGDERYAWVARGILDYVVRDLTGPQGAFLSAEDADSEVPGTGRQEAVASGSAGHAEGAFYLWTRDEIARELGADTDLFCSHFGVEPAGNVPAARDPQGEFRGRNLLRQVRALAATAERFSLDPQAASDRLQFGLVRLRKARARRPRPHRDDKIVTAWNGLMISALARGSEILGERSRLESAVRAADFLRRELYDAETGTLYRSYREGRNDVPGFAEDHAFLIQGLIDLYEASFDADCLQWAVRLQVEMDARFWDDRAGGYFSTRAEDPSIIARLKEDYDGAEPAPGSVAAMNLVRLSWMLGDEDDGPWPRRERARRCIESLRHRWEGAPSSLPLLLCVMDLMLKPPQTVVLAGDPGAADFRALAAVLHEKPGARRALLAADGGKGQRWLAERRPYLADMKPSGGRATAYVCENFVCRRPVTDPDELRALLIR